MQRSRRNATVLLLTCMIRRTDESIMTHLMWTVEWIRLFLLLSVSCVLLSDFLLEHRLYPVPISSFLFCLQPISRRGAKAAPELGCST
jgi:hypothetical protein